MNDKMMGKGMMAPERAAPPNDVDNETPSIFLSQKSLGSQKYRVGDTITLTVTDIDPETGDVQADLASAAGMGASKSYGMNEDFDRAMPEEMA